MTLRLRFDGTWSSLTEGDRRALLARSNARTTRVARDARAIVAAVRRRGDAALFDMARRFDGARLERLEVPRPRMQAALNATGKAERTAMERAAKNIATVHHAFRPRASRVEPESGIVVGRRPDPLDRVGVYAPGGRAAYASTVLMTAIPARVAGVREIVVASPPGRTGVPARPVLAAAAIAGVDRIFAIGGAGAIAALALGTASVPRVDRIVGPGNAYVAAAKLLLVGEVAIDCPAGPSELLVVADETSDLDVVAGEIVAQAEHDPMACALSVIAGGRGPELRAALERQVARAPRRDTIVAALAASGGIIAVRDLAEAMEIANAYAPEHLLLAVDAAEPLLEVSRNAGSVFVGASSSVAFGDYMTGANHVLPTGGAARSYSGLSPLDFVRWTTFQRVERSAARSLSRDTSAFARAERLPGHAAAARRWGAR